MANTTYGLTDVGFVNKRLSDILTDKRAKAVQLFQDLVLPGDVVDTSDSSILGRLIAIDAAGEALIWEQMQEIYAAFDPNSATGIALDNLVALGGITRQSATFSTAQVILSGDNGTLVASGLTIGSTTDASQWTLLSPVALSPTSATGATFSPLVIADNTLYSITYSSISTSNSINYTSGTGATAASIVAGISALVGTSHPTLKASIIGTTVNLSRVDEFSVVSFTSSTNLGITKVQKIGEVQSTVSGPVNAEVNTLTTILTPQLGWDSVTNPIAASAGRDLETDEQLRLRFRETKFERASNILEALYSSLISLEGVQEVRIYENDTDVTNEFGVPPHSFMPIVLGGLSSDIAESIWSNKPMGIRSFGDTVVVIYDSQGVDGSQGFAHSIGFERPDPVPAYITMTIETDSNFPATGKDDIRSNLIAYFAGLGIGDDVVYSRLFTPINLTQGFQVDSLFIGTSPNPTGTGNVVIDFDQIASLSSENIIINS
jgi:uncharacterized phage protein gp47/JayE